MHHVLLALQRIYGCSDERGESRDGSKVPEEEREWRLPIILYVDDLVLCGESEEDPKMMIGRFVKVCRRRGLKVNGDKIKMMMLGE